MNIKMKLKRFAALAAVGLSALAGGGCETVDLYSTPGYGCGGESLRIYSTPEGSSFDYQSGGTRVYFSRRSDRHHVGPCGSSGFGR